MRPIRLEMQAFGPFAEPARVDFTALGTNPLFLINGPTGAGKSSLLDAICFALYGQTTGSERDASQMRCDYADIDSLTQVSLEFSLGAQAYRVLRVPTQERSKARGEGTTTQQTYAQLWKLNPDGADDQLLVAKSALEVTREVETLTGLTVEQFRQVMVLPQGKFREFLLADSQQREAIFSKLFQTQIYKRLEDALKAEAAGIRRQVEGLQNQITGILEGADCASEVLLAEELVTLQPRLAAAAELRQAKQTRLAEVQQQLTLAKGLAQRFNALAESEAQHRAHQARAPQLEQVKVRLQRALRADKLLPHLQRWQEALAEQQKLQQQIAKSQQALDAQKRSHTQALLRLQEAEQGSAQVETWKQEVADLHRWRPLVKTLADAQGHAQKCQAQAAASAQKLQTSSERLTNLRTQAEQLDSERARLGQAIAALPGCEQQLEALVQMGKLRARLDERLQEQAQWQKALAERQQAKARLAQQCSVADRQLKTLELDWHRNQAAVLARELAPGNACPVCGSTSHPQPANPVGTGSEVNKAVIQAAKDALTEVQQQKATADNQLIEAETNLTNVSALINDLKRELGADCSTSTEAFRERWKIQDALRQSLLQQSLQLKQAEQGQAALREELKQLEQSHEQHMRQAQVDEQQRLLSRQACEQIMAQLPEQHRDAGILDQSMRALQQQIDAATQKLEQARQGFTEVDRLLLQAESALTEQRKLNQERATAREVAEQQWLTSLTSQGFADQADYDRACLNDAEQERLSAEVTGYAEESLKLEDRLTQQREQLAAAEPPDLALLQDSCAQATVEAEQASDAWQRLDKRCGELAKVQQKLQAAHEQNASLEAKYQIYGTLSDVAGGQTGNKISLQRFVLSVLLDDVLQEASQRLYSMSKGRYQLLRKEDKTKGNRASGLELEVDDAYTGKARAVATLSGGESFMAALALALGLSDVVQAYAGGIRLETLFIDEGFGSLDQESLDLAIRTLVDLQASGRMIGVISHVSEMREQMPLRVDVIAGKSGSRVEVAGQA